MDSFILLAIMVQPGNLAVVTALCHAGAMRRYKRMEWNCQGIAAHNLSAVEIEAAFGQDNPTSRPHTTI